MDTVFDVKLGPFRYDAQARDSSKTDMPRTCWS